MEWNGTDQIRAISRFPGIKRAMFLLLRRSDQHENEYEYARRVRVREWHLSYAQVNRESVEQKSAVQANGTRDDESRVAVFIFILL